MIWPRAPSHDASCAPGDGTSSAAGGARLVSKALDSATWATRSTGSGTRESREQGGSASPASLRFARRGADVGTATTTTMTTVVLVATRTLRSGPGRRNLVALVVTRTPCATAGHTHADQTLLSHFTLQERPRCQASKPVAYRHLRRSQTILVCRIMGSKDRGLFILIINKQRGAYVPTPWSCPSSDKPGVPGPTEGAEECRT